MRLMISNKAEGALVRLGGTIQASDREEALEKLQAALDMGEKLSLDLSGLTELDTAGLQILLCIHKEARRQNKPVKIIAPSVAVQKVASLFNLTQSLGIVAA